MNLGPTFQDAQMHLLGIFGENNKKLTVWMLFMFLNARASSLFATLEKGDAVTARAQTAQIFAWVAAIANHEQVNVDLLKNLRRHFPMICPSCGEAICDCAKGRLPERIPQEKLDAMESKMPPTDMQLVFFNIFPDNEMMKSAHHLLAEIGELGQEIVRASLTDPSYPHYGRRPGFLLELSDVLANLCAVSSLLNHHLALAVMEHFEKGCTLCGNTKCDCSMEMVELKKVKSVVLEEKHE